MRKEITDTRYIDPDDFGTVGDLIEELEKFRDWHYDGKDRDGDIVLTKARMETDEEMNTRLRREQEAAERKRIATQKKLDAAREKAEKAAAEYAALEDSLKKEME